MPPVAEAEIKSNSLSAFGPARSTVSGTPLSADELRKTHAYWARLQLFDARHDLPSGQPTITGAPEG